MFASAIRTYRRVSYCALPSNAESLSIEHIHNREEFDPVDEADTKERYEIVGTKPSVPAPASSSNETASSSSADVVAVGSKRKSEAELDNDSVKRACTSGSEPASTAAADDDDDDDIVIL